VWIAKGENENMGSTTSKKAISITNNDRKKDNNKNHN